MRILALDSSGLVASVAIVSGADGKADAQTIGEYTMNYKKTHSQTLLPMLDELVKMTELGGGLETFGYAEFPFQPLPLIPVSVQMIPVMVCLALHLIALTIT